MARGGDRAQAWWEAQQRKRSGSPVPSEKSGFWRNPTGHRHSSVPPPAHELLRDITDERRGGPVPITYEPTSTSNPRDPRTAAMGYDPDTKVLRIEWGDGGTPYNYYDVSKDEWRRIQRVKSPGKWINAHLNAKIYGPAE